MKISYCSYCGNKIPEGARFCPFCGKPIDRSLEIESKASCVQETSQVDELEKYAESTSTDYCSVNDENDSISYPNEPESKKQRLDVEDQTLSEKEPRKSSLIYFLVLIPVVLIYGSLWYVRHKLNHYGNQIKEELAHSERIDAINSSIDQELFYNVDVTENGRDHKKIFTGYDFLENNVSSWLVDNYDGFFQVKEIDLDLIYNVRVSSGDSTSDKNYTGAELIEKKIAAWIKSNNYEYTITQVNSTLSDNHGSRDEVKDGWDEESMTFYSPDERYKWDLSQKTNNIHWVNRPHNRQSTSMLINGGGIIARVSIHKTTIGDITYNLYENIRNIQISILNTEMDGVESHETSNMGSSSDKLSGVNTIKTTYTTSFSVQGQLFTYGAINQTFCYSGLLYSLEIQYDLSRFTNKDAEKLFKGFKLT